MNVGLAAIFKNEYPYILEWIAYHESLGVDKFYIADNVSDDGSSELLEALDELNIITRIPFPRSGNEAPQVPAYNYILQTFQNDIDILGFIDADEFIVSKNGLKNGLIPFYENESYGAIGLNWKVYGSNNDFFMDEGLVLERFTKHSEQSYDNNRHIKSFLKPSYVAKMNIHQCELKKGIYCDANYEKAMFDETNAKTLNVNYGNLHVNHYVVKSRLEHFINKRRKGSAAGSAIREKGIAYFRAHDINEATTFISPKVIENIYNRVNSLKAQILAHTSFMQLGQGHINLNANNISGWCTLDSGKAPKFVKILINNNEHKVPINRERPDVFAKGLSAELQCGFSLPINELSINSIQKITGFIYGSVQELNVDIV